MSFAPAHPPKGLYKPGERWYTTFIKFIFALPAAALCGTWNGVKSPTSRSLRCLLGEDKSDTWQAAAFCRNRNRVFLSGLAIAAGLLSCVRRRVGAFFVPVYIFLVFPWFVLGRRTGNR